MPKRKRESFNFFNQVYLPLPNVLLELVVSYNDMLFCFQCKKLYPFNLVCLHCIKSGEKIEVITKDGYGCCDTRESSTSGSIDMEFLNNLDQMMWCYIQSFINGKATWSFTNYFYKSYQMPQRLTLKVTRRPKTRKQKYPNWWNITLEAIVSIDILKMH